jgi:dTMP kinase
MINPPYIVIEGFESVGKTTLMALAIEVTSEFFQVKQTRQPGGTPSAEKIRQAMVEYHPEDPISPRTQVLLAYAARDHLYDNFLIPALTSGYAVVCSRGQDSTEIYQGMIQGENTVINDLRGRFVYRPDITMYLAIDAEVSAERTRKKTELDTMDMKFSFDPAIAQAYEQYFRGVQAKLDYHATWMERHTPQIKRVDANHSLETVKACFATQLRQALKDYSERDDKTHSFLDMVTIPTSNFFG